MIVALALAAALGLGAAHAQQARPSATLCPSAVAHPASLVRFDSHSKPIRAALYRPVGQGNGAAIVLLHGAGGLAPDLERFDVHAQALAAAGYHVILPSYYDATDGAAGHSDRALRRWRSAAIDAVRYLGEIEGVRPDAIGLWGFSLGGALAGEAAMHSDLARAAVAVAAAAPGETVRARRRGQPVLVILAAGDPVVMPTSTRAWAQALDSRGARVQTVTLPSTSHFFDAGQWCEIFARSRAFFDQTLLTPAI